MKVVWADAARADLSAIRAYISRDSAYYASRVVGRIVAATRILERFPELGAIVPEFADSGIRERLSQAYRILYRVQSDHVLILAVVHSARDLTHTMLDR